jgi:hypothetical protein
MLLVLRLRWCRVVDRRRYMLLVVVLEAVSLVNRGGCGGEIGCGCACGCRLI